MKEQNNKKANIICWISLACGVVPWGVWMLTDKLQEITGAGDFFRILCNVADSLSAVGGLVAIVLMIYVRIKYPQNLFGKILMWLYIILIILAILFLIFVFIMCSTCIGGVESCIYEIRGCDN